MTRFETLEQATVNQILQAMLTADEIERIQPDIKQFMNHKHDLPSSVVKVIIIKSIIFTKNKGDKPNAAYMRMVAESFKAEGAITLAKAIEKMDRDKEYALKQTKNNEPSWLNDYKRELEQMEERA